MFEEIALVILIIFSLAMGWPIGILTFIGGLILIGIIHSLRINHARDQGQKPQVTRGGYRSKSGKWAQPKMYWLGGIQLSKEKFENIQREEKSKLPPGSCSIKEMEKLLEKLIGEIKTNLVDASKEVANFANHLINKVCERNTYSLNKKDKSITSALEILVQAPRHSFKNNPLAWENWVQNNKEKISLK